MQEYGRSIRPGMLETVPLSAERLDLIKKTYACLTLSVVAAFFGAYVGSSSSFVLSLFTKWYGWVLAMILINAIPQVAIACRHNPVLGTMGLVADGFFAGIILGPAVYVAGRMATGGNILFNAVAITFGIFIAVTLFVWVSKRQFSPPRYLMGGIFLSLIVAVAVNMIAPIGILGLIICIGLGIFGMLVLLYATSGILYDESIDHPIIGALMLFSGIFNVFVAVLQILTMFGGDD